MAGALYRGDKWTDPVRTRDFGRVEHVDGPAFCDKWACKSLAVWRIGYGQQKVELCPRHALSVMRNRRIWSRR